MNDLRGNPVGTHSAPALQAAEHALWRMMSFYGTPFDDLAAAQAADPNWVLPRLMHAGFLLGLTEPAVRSEARTLLARARPLAWRAPEREQAHWTALRRLLEGDWQGACQDWEVLLLRHPRDALALHWAHLFDFHRGDAANLRLRVARVLPQWGGDDPLHPYVLGQYAFGLEECQLYDQAEAMGRQALATSAKVPWAIHAVAHVMEMQGRSADGSAWMRHWHADWTQGNGFASHLGWHEALFALESMDTATALALFDRFIGPEVTEITLQRVDAAALLWRLSLLGVDVGHRWHALAAGWDLQDGAAGLYPFNDLHAVLALIGSGQVPRARQWCAGVLGSAARRPTGLRAVIREAAVPLMRGLLAYAESNFDECVDRLYAARASAFRCGGSHAQRDLIDQTVLAASCVAHDKSRGRALLNERRLAKPVTELTHHWARCLDLPLRESVPA